MKERNGINTKFQLSAYVNFIVRTALKPNENSFMKHTGVLHRKIESKYS